MLTIALIAIVFLVFTGCALERMSPDAEEPMGKNRNPNVRLGGPSTWKKRERPVTTGKIDPKDWERIAAMGAPKTLTDDDDLRRRVAEQIRVSFDMGSVRWDAAPVMDFTVRVATPDPIAQFKDQITSLNRVLESARAEIQKRDDFIAKLKESPQSIVTVMRMVSDKRGVVQVGGAALEVNLPEGCKVGDQVKILVETSQAVSKADEPMTFGAVVTVDRIESGRCFFELNGGGQVSASLADGMTIEAGDRVQLDPSGTVALTNLGRDKTKYSIESCPNVTWDDIGGHEEAKEALRESLEYPTTFAATYMEYGAAASKGVLLYGPPGTGKTLLSKAAANSVAKNGTGGFIYVKGAELLSKWVGESESTVRGLFARARAHKKATGNLAVIFIDEADALLGTRGSGTMAGALSSTIVPSFLAEMDGIEDSGAFVILSTNRPDTLDPAVIRDGRIDRRIRVGRPDRQSTRDILRLAVRGKLFPTYTEVEERIVNLIWSDQFAMYQLEYEGEQTEHIKLADMLSGAVLTGFIGRATRNAIRRDRGGESRGITFEDVERAIAESFAELSVTNPFELITEKLDQVGKIPTAIRKATHRAGSEAPQFGHASPYGTNVQRPGGSAPN